MGRLIVVVILVGEVLSVALLCGEEYMLRCPFNSLTGWDCPFCGTQRMVRALLHCRWAEAFGYNALIMIASPLFILAGLRILFPSLTLQHRRFTLEPLFTDRALLVYLVILILWGVSRNIFSW